VAAVLVQLEWQDGHPEFGRVIPYVTLRLSTNIRSMHHAGDGAHPAIAMAHRRAWSLSVMPGNSQRNSMAADSSPP